jgi:hypothetical protein
MKHPMKTKIILDTALIVFLFAISACGTSIGVNGISTSTPTPCITTQTNLSGQSTFATPMSSQPTFSPEMQATAEARLKQANPGNSPYPGPGQPVSPLPPCPTNTPSATAQPQVPQGGFAQGTLSPSQPILSPDQIATANARMQLANPGAPTTPH